MNDGGQAFLSAAISSCEGSTNVNVIDKEGMTLLDYFAGQALIGSIASSNPTLDIGFADLAEWSYGQAAAMLAERDRRMEGGES